MRPESIELLARFAISSERLAAAAELARNMGVDRILLFVRDPELEVWLPAPGFPQTVRGGPLWRSFVNSWGTSGVRTADVDYPVAERRMAAVAHVSEDGTAAVFVGGRLDWERFSNILGLLPLLGALFRAEQTAQLARGEVQMARALGESANHLALALDAARSDAETAGAEAETARAEAETVLAEKARLNNELIEMDRRKDDFLAVLGHELRNPMAAIAGAVEVMRAHPSDVAVIDRIHAILERQTDHLARLVDDLLDVARVAQGKVVLHREDLEVEEIVHRAIETMQGTLTAKDHDTQVEIRSRVYVNADRTRFQQMLTNLLANAAKYTDVGGHIIITVEHDGTRAIIRIRDNGIGIPSEMLPKIFQPFVQVDRTIDRSAGGLGVGLAVVSRLAALHGGTVTAKSEVGKGSEFTIQLPAVLAPLSAPAPAEKPPQSTKKSVLVVDDNRDSVEMLVTLVKQWGHQPFSANDGTTALALALEVRPDIILLDIGLPDMDGYAVAARLRERKETRNALIIAVSGYGQDSDRRKSRAAGCDDHLIKPVEITALRRALTASNPP